MNIDGIKKLFALKETLSEEELNKKLRNILVGVFKHGSGVGKKNIKIQLQNIITNY